MRNNFYPYRTESTAATGDVTARYRSPAHVSAVVVLTVSTGPLFAAGPEIAPSAGVGIGQMISVLGGLLLVLGIFAALVWGLKRSRALNLGGSAQLEVMGGLSFGMRDRVVLVRAEQRRVLLAVGPNGISALSEWGEDGNDGFRDTLRDSVASLRGTDTPAAVGAAVAGVSAAEPAPSNNATSST